MSDVSKMLAWVADHAYVLVGLDDAYVLGDAFGDNYVFVGCMGGKTESVTLPRIHLIALTRDEVLKNAIGALARLAQRFVPIAVIEHRDPGDEHLERAV